MLDIGGQSQEQSPGHAPPVQAELYLASQKLLSIAEPATQQ